VGYDVIIVGAGPAGLSSAIYAARQKMKAVVFEEETLGGQIAKTYVIENYPGVMPTSGEKLANTFKEQVESLGVEIKFEKVVDLKRENHAFTVKTATGEYRAKAIILATGMGTRKLNFKGEHEFLGRGVSHCTMCDGPLFKGKTVAIVGGGNSAATAALFMTGYASKVYLVHRRGELRAEPILQEKVFSNAKIEVLFNKVIDAVEGDEFVKKATLKDVKTGETLGLNVDGVFVEVGGVPINILASKLGVELNDNGYVKVDKEQKTSVEGVFAAGDVTDHPLKQVVTAAAGGAMAAMAAYKYVKTLRSQGVK
jgi:thioredoxin reductase (NADPH)